MGVLLLVDNYSIVSTNLLDYNYPLAIYTIWLFNFESVSESVLLLYIVLSHLNVEFSFVEVVFSLIT